MGRPRPGGAACCPGVLTLFRFALTLLLLSARLSSAEPVWKSVFYHDEDESAFTIRDLQCTSTLHCVALGLLEDKKGDHVVANVTTDGGVHWKFFRLSDRALRASFAYFLDSRQGWLAAGQGIWKTEDGGETWKELARVNGVVARLHFFDAQHGFATGSPKAV